MADQWSGLERLHRAYMSSDATGIVVGGGKVATDYAQALLAAAPALLAAAREGAELRRALESVEKCETCSICASRVRAALAGKGGGNG